MKTPLAGLKHLSQRVIGALRQLSWLLEIHPHLRGRERVSIQEILRSYYDAAAFDMQLLTEVWKDVSSELSEHPGRLRPTDRLLIELERANHPLVPLEDERAFMIRVVRFECRRAGISIDWDQLSSVDDYVRALYACRERKKKQGGRHEKSAAVRAID